MKSSDGKENAKSSFRKRRREKPKRSVVRDSAVNKNAGRPNSLSEDKLAMLLEAYYSRPYSFRQLADMFGVSRMTVWRAVQDVSPVMAPRVMG
jgi:predicted DNA binding protein